MGTTYGVIKEAVLLYTKFIHMHSRTPHSISLHLPPPPSISLLLHTFIHSSLPVHHERAIVRQDHQPTNPSVPTLAGYRAHPEIQFVKPIHPLYCNLTSKQKRYGNLPTYEMRGKGSPPKSELTMTHHVVNWIPTVLQTTVFPFPFPFRPPSNRRYVPSSAKVNIHSHHQIKDPALAQNSCLPRARVTRRSSCSCSIRMAR